jgi:hypothetical protein
MPGSASAYGRRGMWTVARNRAKTAGTVKFGIHPEYSTPARSSAALSSIEWVHTPAGCVGGEEYPVGPGWGARAHGGPEASAA